METSLKWPCEHDLIKNKGVYIGDILYWLIVGDQIIFFDVENKHYSLISILDATIDSSVVCGTCIGEYEGKLHHVKISIIGLRVWCYDSVCGWIPKYDKGFDHSKSNYLKLFPRNLKIKVENSSSFMDAIGFKDENLLIKAFAQLLI